MFTERRLGARRGSAGRSAARTMTPLRIAYALAAVLLATSPACTAAQSSARGYTDGALGRLVARLHADPTLTDSLRGLSRTEVVSDSNMNFVSRLEDSSAAEFVRVLAQTLHQLPDSLCGAFLGGPSGQDPTVAVLLRYADSATVDGWMDVLYALIRVQATPAPNLPVATDAEIQAADPTVSQHLNTADRQRFMRIVLNPPPTPTDACWAARTMFDGFARLPVAQLGPVVRAMFARSSDAPTGH